MFSMYLLLVFSICCFASAGRIEISVGDHRQDAVQIVSPSQYPHDSDGDGIPDASDDCPNDPFKAAPGRCGCGVSDSRDTDGDGVVDCLDGCPLDARKTDPGKCGCGIRETDSDRDGTPDCIDGCPLNGAKTSPGVCGCRASDLDSDGDGVPDCLDVCPNDTRKSTREDTVLCDCGVGSVECAFEHGYAIVLGFFVLSLVLTRRKHYRQFFRVTASLKAPRLRKEEEILPSCSKKLRRRHGKARGNKENSPSNRGSEAVAPGEITHRRFGTVASSNYGSRLRPLRVRQSCQGGDLMC